MAWGSTRGISHKGLLFDGGIPFLQTTLTKNQDENLPVKVTTTAKTVDLCEADDLFDGVVLVVGEGVCTVQVKGFVTLTYTGTAPTIGRVKLEAGADGAVQVDAENGREYLVTDVDSTAKTVTFLLG